MPYLSTPPIEIPKRNNETSLLKLHSPQLRVSLPLDKLRKHSHYVPSFSSAPLDLLRQIIEGYHARFVEVLAAALDC